MLLPNSQQTLLDDAVSNGSEEDGDRHNINALHMMVSYITSTHNIPTRPGSKGQQRWRRRCLENCSLLLSLQKVLFTAFYRGRELRNVYH